MRIGIALATFSSMAAETLLELDPLLTGNDGKIYRARACGRPHGDGLWEGWLEFESIDGELVWRTSRETTQPNHADLVYWATGISKVFLEGALRRAMTPAPHVVVRTPAPPAFDGPAGEVDVIADVAEAVAAPVEPVLDPFVAYARGEVFLRRRLDALDAWHLRTIAIANRFVTTPAALDRLTKPELVELIVESVRGLESARSLT
jgi:hypothetical protein